MLQPLVYSKFSLYKLNPDDMEKAEIQPYPFCDPSTFRIVTVINEPATQIVYEDWFKGQDVSWTYFVDAIHFVTEGSAEITVWPAPDYIEKIVVVAEAPCVYLTPRGAKVHWKILSDVFRKIVCDIPNPGYVGIAPDLK